MALETECNVLIWLFVIRYGIISGGLTCGRRALARDRLGCQPEERAILEEGTRPENHLKMGDALADLGRNNGLTNEDVEPFEKVRDRTPTEPMRFE